MTNPKILARLEATRVRLINQLPFIGGLSLGMPVELTDRYPIAATDGVTVFFNPVAVELMSGSDLLFIYAHELCHKAMMHPWRRGHRKPGKWNRAADYVINGDLVKSGLTMPKSFPGLYDTRYVGMFSEQVYDLLPDQPDDDRYDDCLDAPPDAHEVEAQLDVMQSARAAKMMGDRSATVDRVLEEATDTVVNYYALMRRFITERSDSDYVFSRPNRRFIYQGLYLPSLYSEELGEIGIGVDTSASIINRELGEYFKDVNSITDDVRPSKVWVFYCDAKVKRVDCFARGERVIPTPVGGGGTSFTPVFNEVQRRGLNLKCLLYFTDLEGSFPSAPPSYPVMWLTKSRSAAPFGETVRIR